MMSRSFSPSPLIWRASLCGVLLIGLGACATTPRIQSVDRLFPMDSVALEDLDHMIDDIKIRGIDDSPVMVLVKYRLTSPYLASANLAQDQGDTVRTYFEEHLQAAKRPVEVRVRISPAHVTPNQLWISYSVDMNKGSGIRMQEPPAPKMKSEEKPNTEKKTKKEPAKKKDD